MLELSRRVLDIKGEASMGADSSSLTAPQNKRRTSQMRQHLIAMRSYFSLFTSILAQS
jgi:hypothetical protein